MANKITTLFDLDDKGFTKGIKDLRKNVAEADGFVGKLKAGVSGLGGVLKENAAYAAMAAGSALATFSVKAAQSFATAALEAGKFSDATGVTVEQASRLIEVAGDLGIEADTVQAALQRMNKAASDGSLEIAGFGETIVRAKDGTVDAYESFINAATAIGAIADPTQRAKAAQETFGKSYGQIAELMAMDATALREALNGVSEAKLIDEAELAKAKHYRESMDSLRDRLEDLALTVGERVLPRLTELAEGAVSAAEGLGKMYDVLVPVGEKLFGVNAGAQNLEQQLFDLAPAIEKAGLNFEEMFFAVTSGALPLDELKAKLIEAGIPLDDVNTLLGQNADAAEEAASKNKNLADAIENAGSRQARSAEAARYQAQATHILRQRLEEYTAAAEGIPADIYSEIRAALNAGDLARAEALLNEVARTRIVQVGIAINSAATAGAAAGAGKLMGNAVSSAISAAVAGAKMPSSVGGGGGGGGGGGQTPAEAESDTWDEVLAKQYEYGERTREQYIQWIEEQMAAEDKMSDRHLALFQLRKRLLGEIAAEEEAIRKEQEKAAKEAEDQAKKVAEQQLSALEKIASLLADLKSVQYGNLEGAPGGGNTYGAGGLTIDPSGFVAWLADQLRGYQEGLT